jgi:hypothetical protein
MIALSFEYFNQPSYYANVFSLVNTVFMTIFAADIIFKLIALKQHFFRNIEHVFDFLVTILCLIGIILLIVDVFFYI